MSKKQPLVAVKVWLIFLSLCIKDSLTDRFDFFTYLYWVFTFLARTLNTIPTPS